MILLLICGAYLWVLCWIFSVHGLMNGCIFLMNVINIKKYFDNFQHHDAILEVCFLNALLQINRNSWSHFFLVSVFSVIS